MIKKTFYFITLSAACILLSACDGKEIQGTGDVVSKERDVLPFSSIDVRGAYYLMLEGNKPQHVSVSTNENLLPYVLTTVDNDTLSVNDKNGFKLQPTGDQVVQVISNKVNTITLSGANKFVATNILADDFSVNMNGATRANITGTIKNFKLDANGATNIEARNIDAENVDLHLTGSGTITIRAKKSLTVEITGSAKVEYFGQPEKITQKISGSGEIIQVGGLGQEEKIFKRRKQK